MEEVPPPLCVYRDCVHSSKEKKYPAFWHKVGTLLQLYKNARRGHLTKGQSRECMLKVNIYRYWTLHITELITYFIYAYLGQLNKGRTGTADKGQLRNYSYRDVQIFGLYDALTFDPTSTRSYRPNRSFLCRKFIFRSCSRFCGFRFSSRD